MLKSLKSPKSKVDSDCELAFREKQINKWDFIKDFQVRGSVEQHK